MRPCWILAFALVACETGKPVPDGGVDDPVVEDADEDGFRVEDGDCDDDDASVNPAAPEVCDDVDQDCDGEVDDGVLGTWYADDDGDGYGDPGTEAEACAGDTEVAGDCDDADASVNPDAQEVCDGVDQDCDGEADDGVTSTWWADADADGYGDADAPVQGCEPPEGAVDNAEDCNDASEASSPANEETCDERDNDCDGVVDEGVTSRFWVDVDVDGHGDASASEDACDAPTGYAEAADDCAPDDPTVSPDATEVCDGVDNDCDGTADEADAADAATWYDDADGDGWGDADAATVSCEAPAGAVAVDGDCDDTDATLTPDTAWYLDYDADGYGDAAWSLAQCEAPAGYVRDDTDCDDAAASVSPEGTETCNEVDDDCDGLVDDDDDPVTGTSTWYADTDGDGYGDATATTAACDAPAGRVSDGTDCDDADADVHPTADEDWYDGVDSDCDGDDDPSVCDEVPGGTTVAWDDTCAYPYAGSGWSVTTEWSTDSSGYFASGSSYDNVMMMPAVGQLSDDDGDGDVDDEDTPDVAFTTFTSSSYSSAGYLRVVSGDGSGDFVSVASVRSGSTTYSVAGTAGVALGDLEGDGSPDIVTVSTGGDVIALENDGTLKWVYDSSVSQYAYPSVADMDGDGDAEVVVGPLVLSDAGGLVGTCSVGSSAYPTVLADVDGDGTLDLVLGHAVCSMTGTLLWNSGRTQGWPGVGNFDADDAPEVVNVDKANDRVDLLDDDGTLLWSTAVYGGGGGPPVVADVDGDGSPEIGVGGYSRFAVYESSGSVKWRYTTEDDSSESTGASAFDFDGDGVLELLYADEHTLRIFDGASGTVLYSDTGHASGTLREYPVVADVDRDGQAEVVVASCDYGWSGWAGVRALGESNGEWASARLAWNQHAYAQGLVGDDLSVPTDPTSEWLDTNTFRAQRSWSEEPDGAADLSAVLLGVCDDCVNGEVDVYVSIDNLGAVFVPPGVTARLYAVSGSTRTLLEEQTTSAAVDPGERTAPLRFTVDIADIGSDGLEVELDEDDAVRECDETNNAATWSDAVCTS